MKLFQNQIFKASVAFIVFSNILMLNKYYNGLHWMNGFAFATHGLIPFLLTVLSVITLLASLIFMLQGTKKFILFVRWGLASLLKYSAFEKHTNL